jgi:DNA-binding HxlR family transcriptional regulator
MALVILRLRWTFSILHQLSYGPQHPTRVAAAINAGITRNRDIAGNRSMSEKVLWDTLHRLVDAGFINHQPRAGQFASTAQCTLTPSGHALLATLAPLGSWAIRHEVLLTTIVQRRRGLTDHRGHLG